MQAYIIRRLLLMIPTFLVVTITVFFLIRFVPGSIIDQMVQQMGATGGGLIETREQLEEVLGLDVPVHRQYGAWLGVWPNKEGHFSGILQGDVGSSLWRRVPVSQEIFERLPISLELGILGIITALILAIPIGTYSAIRQDSWGDYTGRSIAILAISLPSFWVGTMVMVYPSIWWGWSPAIKYIPFVTNPLGNLQQFIIPAVILGMVLSGGTMRMVRTMMLEVLRQDYIRTAWAKGLTERVIVLRHALKNALIPVITVVGSQIPILIAGEVIIETIFVLPGIGLLLVEALGRRDYPVISGVNLFTATAVMIVNLVVDLTYGYLDPRVQYR